MHTTEINGFTFHFNPDLSGDVEIGTPDDVRFSIPGDVLVEFLGQRQIEADIARLQRMTGTYRFFKGTP